MTDYRAVAEGAHTTFQEILADEEGWKKCRNVSKILISSKKSTYYTSGSRPMFKADFEIDAPVEKVLHYWNANPRGCRADWDAGVSSAEGFQILDDEAMLARITVPSSVMGLIAPREYIDAVVQRRYPEKNMAVISSVSIEHKDYPITRDFVRGKNYPGGIAVTSVPGTPEKTRVCYLAHTDIGGNVPVTLINFALPIYIHAMLESMRKSITDDADEGSAI